MIDAIVFTLPEAEATLKRQELEGKSWDEVTSDYRRYQAGLKTEEVSGTAMENKPSQKGTPNEAGIQMSIKTLVVLESQTAGKNYKDAFKKAIKVLSNLLQ